MAKTNSKTNQVKDLSETAANATAKDTELEADVLFQKIYNKWYAFSIVGDECLMTPISDDEIQKRLPSGRKARQAA